MHCQFCGAALESLPIACPFCGSQAVLGERYEIRAIIGRGGMGQVVEKSLAPLMRDRFSTAAAFYDALYRGIEGHSPFRPVVPARPAITPKAVAIITLLVILGIVGIAITVAVSTPDGRSTNTLRQVPTPNVPQPTPLPNFRRPPPFNCLPFPKASEVPPIVEEARGKFTAATMRGPQKGPVQPPCKARPESWASAVKFVIQLLFFFPNRALNPRQI